MTEPAGRRPGPGPQPSAPSPGIKTVCYAEDHCALRWPLLAAGLAAPVIVVASAVAGIVLGSAWFLAVLVPAVAVAATAGQMLPYVWPAGIRLDQHGVRIGGVRWADRHPGRTHRRATVPYQWGQEFGCPWPGVQRIGVVTGRESIKTMIRYSYHGRKPTPLGNLATPFMRAALVIWVDRGQAMLPAIRRARGPLSANWSSPGFHQPVWVAPTRHPQRLRAALQQIPQAASIAGDPARDPFADAPLNPREAGWEF